MRLPRFLVHALLALLLVAAQGGAVLHALHHAIDAASADRIAKDVPRLSACERCLAFAALDAAAPPALAPPAATPADAGPPRRVAVTIAPRLRFDAYRSRAPPLFG